MANWLPIYELKKRLSITDPNGTHEDDSLFSVVSEEACSWIEQQTGRKILSATYTRIFNGNGRDTIFLPVIPATSFTSATVGTTALTLGTADQYRQGTVTCFWTPDRIVYPSKFTVGTANVKLVWVAGYAQASIPSRIIGLACTVAILKWRERDRYGDSQKQFPNQTTMYERELKGQDAKTYRELLDWRKLYIEDGIDV